MVDGGEEYIIRNKRGGRIEEWGMGKILRIEMMGTHKALCVCLFFRSGWYVYKVSII